MGRGARIFSQAVKLNPHAYEFYTARSEASFALSRYEEALADANTALEINHRSVVGYYDRALVNKTMHNYTAAIQDLNQAIAIEPLSKLYSLRASISFLLKRYADAVKDNERALSLNSHVKPSSQQQVMVDLKTGDYEQAIDDFGEPAKTPDKRATRIYSTADLDSVVKGYSHVLAVAPTDASALYNRGLSFLCLKKPEFAAKDFELFAQKCEFKNTRILAVGYEAIALRQAHQEARANSVLSSININDTKHWPESLLCYLQSKITAEELFETAKTKDNLVRAKCFVALTLLQRGDNKKARPLLEWIIAKGDPKLDEYTLAESQMPQAK